MEEENKSLENIEPQTPRVGFPEIKKKSKLPLTLFLLVVVLGLAFGGWVLFTSPEQKEKEAEITPTPVAMNEEATPTPAKEIERKDVKIQVLNGTGLDKAASSLKEKLMALGYEKIEAGNATKKDYEKTVVTFSEGASDAVREEIERELKRIYEKVEIETLDVKSYGVKIITGYPKGHTPTPTVTKSPSKTPTPIASGSATITPTKTPTPTP